MSRSESVVVWDFRSVVAALTTSRGFSRVDVVEGLCGGGVTAEGRREVWKCDSRVCVVFVTSMRALRSLGFAILGHRQMCGVREKQNV